VAAPAAGDRAGCVIDRVEIALRPAGDPSYRARATHTLYRAAALRTDSALAIAPVPSDASGAGVGARAALDVKVILTPFCAFHS
jgi:hypothetical protein